MGTDGNITACGLEEWVPIPIKNSTTSKGDLAVAVCNVPFGIFAFLSNLAIIVTAIKTPSLQKPSNILLCSVATADCVTAVTLQPMFVAWWMLIQRAHESCSYLEELTSFYNVVASLMTGWPFVIMAVVSCDRRYALSKPLAYRAKVTKGDVTKVAIFTSLGWLLTALCVSNLPPKPRFFVLVSLGPPAFIIPIANHIAMFFAIRRHNRQVKDAVSSQQLLVILKREKRVALDMFIITITLVICLIPKVVVVSFYESLGSLYSSLYVWSSTLLLLNSSINPLFYLFRNSELRSAVRSVLRI